MKILDIALKNIKANREKAINIAQDNLDTLRKDNNFALLEGKIDWFNLEIARSKVYKLEYKDIEEMVKNLQKEMDDYLIIKGISAFSLIPQYKCKKCHDTGIIDGHYCQCVKDEAINLQYKEYPFLKEMPQLLDEVDYLQYGENADKFQSGANFLKRKVVENFDNTSIFTLQGNAGIGKSYLAFICAKMCIENGQEVMIINAIKLNKLFLEYHLTSLNNKEKVLETVNNCDLLIIDDLGVEQVLNNVTVPYLYQTLIERLGKKTIITTNLSLRDLEMKYDQRIVSRLMDKQNSAVILLSGKDLRISLH